MKLNEHYFELKDSYLFATVGRKTAEYKKAHPEKDVIRLSIGDVTRPLAPAVIEAMHKAVDDMSRKETFHGYGPDQTCYGYGALIESIKGSYTRKGVSLETEEVFISDGAKSDLGNILELFADDTVALIPDPVYPAYVDANVMSGRKVIYSDANEGNGFLPMPDDNVHADLVYLCSPNNPTGAAYSKEQLKAWVDYAKKHDAILLYDAAYEYFIQDETLARSIYQVEGAKECAIEICSYSKTAGFTGVRCGYTIVPTALVRGGHSLNRMWARRQSTKFNGVSYITQMGRRPCSAKRGRSRSARISTITGRTLRSLPTAWTASASGTRAASTRPISGSDARTAWIAGHSSICSSKKPTSSGPRAAASARTERAISA